MVAGDIVPVAGEMFEQTLASAGPDVLRAMVREFAQRMMDADVEVRCNQREVRGGHLHINVINESEFDDN